MHPKFKEGQKVYVKHGFHPNMENDYGISSYKDIENYKNKPLTISSTGENESWRSYGHHYNYSVCENGWIYPEWMLTLGKFEEHKKRMISAS